MMAQTKNQFKEVAKLQEDVIRKIQTKRKYDLGVDCNPVDFRKASNIEVTDKVILTDLSTDEQVKLGVNVFKAVIAKTTTSPIHSHKDQSQLIHVKRGSVYDNVSKMRFESGQSFFISKNNSHSLKFLKNSTIIFIFMPSLTILEDDN